ncbi:aldehyde dehydrogenase family protein [Bradyrhizobium sp. 76]|uniref:aldehyde dehydrogenase family protein n=1 Tax=Bradyrhizobium sp. 76 TaxID=2782680 RepID=UPI001FF99483|nr:aldehyde dehydrogenase family protein [Bradyrhizobium sp. 76]
MAAAEVARGLLHVTDDGLDSRPMRQFSVEMVHGPAAHRLPWITAISAFSAIRRGSRNKSASLAQLGDLQFDRTGASPRSDHCVALARRSALGGKNPAYVTRNADLERAAPGVARSAFGLQGAEMLRLLGRLRRQRGQAGVHRQARELFVQACRGRSATGRDIHEAGICDIAYRLSAGIFTRDQNELQYFPNTAEAGVLYANRASGATTGAWPGAQPFCGWKARGSGKGGLGAWFLPQYMREQSHTIMTN